MHIRRECNIVYSASGEENHGSRNIFSRIHGSHSVVLGSINVHLAGSIFHNLSCYQYWQLNFWKIIKKVTCIRKLQFFCLVQFTNDIQIIYNN